MQNRFAGGCAHGREVQILTCEGRPLSRNSNTGISPSNTLQYPRETDTGGTVEPRGPQASSRPAGRSEGIDRRTTSQCAAAGSRKKAKEKENARGGEGGDEDEDEGGKRQEEPKLHAGRGAGATVIRADSTARGESDGAGAISPTGHLATVAVARGSTRDRELVQVHSAIGARKPPGGNKQCNKIK